MAPLTPAQVSAFLSAFPSTKESESMAAHTYLKIGGPARLYFVANTTEEMVKAVEKARELEIPWYVFGGGSNLLVSDDGFQGVVIQTGDRTTSIDGETVSCAPGVFTGLLARSVADAGLTGFEWGIGVPGMIGGATYGNAGCFGGEMKDVVTSVEAYRVSDGQRVTYAGADCGFSYRESRFKHEPHLILKTVMTLKKGSAEDAKAKLNAIASKRKLDQPQGVFTAGCLFKNFDFTDESVLEKIRREGDEVPADMLSSKRIGAGWLIDKLGLKGKAIGKAQISPVHGNFLVNQGGATAQDVLQLSSYVKMKVRDELGILLEDEVQYLGF